MKLPANDIIRWKGAVALAVTSVVALATLILTGDDLVRRELQRIATQLNRAPVEIGDLTLDLLRGKMELRGVRIAHHTRPDTNRFEVDQVRVSFAPAQLLWKKLTIQDLVVEGVHHNTHRSLNAPSEPVDAPEIFGVPSLIDRVTVGFFKGLRHRLEENPLKHLGQLSSGLNLASHAEAERSKLFTVRAIEDFRIRLQRALEQWSQRKESLPEESWIANVESRLRADRAPAAAEGREMRATVGAALKEVQSARDWLGGAFGPLAEQLQDLTPSARNDVAHIRKRLELPDLSADDLTLALFGPEVLNYLERLVYWIDASRRWMPTPDAGTASPDNGSRRRHWSLKQDRRGRSIHFSPSSGAPAALLMAARLETGTSHSPNLVRVEGSAEGFTTDPSLWGKPARAILKAQFPRGLDSLRIDVALDHTGSAPAESVLVDFKGFHLQDLSLYQGGDLEFSIPRATAEGFLNVVFQESTVSIHLSAYLSDVRYHIASRSPRVEGALRRASAPYFSFPLQVRIEGPFERFQTEISSPLGKSVAASLQEEFKHSLGAVDDTLLRTVLDLVERERRELLQQAQDTRLQAETLLDRRERRLQALLTLADKKVN